MYGRFYYKTRRVKTKRELLDSDFNFPEGNIYFKCVGN